MTVQNLLEKMNERAFGPAFQEYLFDTYKAMAQADFPEEEKGYRRPRTTLSPHCSTPRLRF